MLLWTAFTIGLFGSMHCVGMCGPIAMTVATTGQAQVWKKALLYNLGRTFTYTLLGALVGLLGKGIELAGLQKSFSIGLGVVFLIIAIFSINVESRLLSIGFMNNLFFKLKASIARKLNDLQLPGTFYLGMLNGLLPCGLVYVAIFGAISTSGWADGMAYMAIFGLGTLPLMAAVVFIGNMATLKFRMVLRKIYPAFLVLFALLFIARGLNFHLPGDFFFWEKMQDMPMCH